MRTLHPVAAYLSSPNKRVAQKPKVLQLVGSLAAFFLVVVIFIFSLGLNPSVVLAADGDDGFDSSQLEGTFDGANPDDLNDYLAEYDAGVGNNTFQYVLGRLFTPQYINYLPDAAVAGNVAPKASAIGYSPNGGTTYGNYICHDNQQGAGTPIYHNCDVPNFMGEFVQNLYSLFDRSGAQNATAINAASVLLPSFGQSKAIPNGSVPADPAGGSYKYTALELYGYDLQVSSYLGEWDHIQTMTTARLLTNFSFFDSVSLTAKTIGDAIGGAFTVAGGMAAEGWNTGGIFGAISGFYVGLFEGGASAAMNTLLDTSDANIILSNGWFRVNYAETAYGLREMTNQEIAAQIRAAFLSYMNSSMPKNETYDEWLKLTAPTGSLMGTGPVKAISKCEVNQKVGGATSLVEITSAGGNDNTKSPGVSEADCTAQQNTKDTEYFNSIRCGTYSSGGSYPSGCVVLSGGNYFQNKTSGSVTEATSDTAKWKSVVKADFKLGAAVWSVDGTRKAESFNDWYSRVKSTAGNWDGNISKYSVGLSAASCTPANAGSTDGDTAAAAYTSFISNCWSPAWSEAATANERDNQTGTNSGWLTSLLTQAVLAKWTQANPDVFDFNSPWKRFICLNADGSDVTNGTYNDTISGGDQGTPILVKAFSKTGAVNSLCPQPAYRAPIQGGLFGDGYNGAGADQSPGNDTRHISNFFGVATVALYPLFIQPVGNISQGMMGIGQIATQISNEVITWTYMPILDSLGINDAISNLIEGLRDSIFFPLAALMAAAGGLWILYQTGVRRRYREMFSSAGFLALTFILGAVLMVNPSNVVNFVDRAPANVEKAVMGLILAPVVDGDRMCSTDSTAPGGSSTSGWDDLDLGAKTSGADDVNDLFSADYSAADDSLREILCANWKAFVYYPWVYSQWGTSPENLDDSLMTNSNEALVGTAAVDMGGSNGVVNNWGLYQLDAMKLGSSTQMSWSITGFTLQSKDFYKIVDMQAGPNDGAGTDSRYLDAWAGMDPMNRLVTGFMSGTVAVFGSVTVIAYSFTKLIITLISVLMLIFLPFVFLLGMFPSKRKFVKDYLMTIVSLAIQRVALMLVIAIFIFMLLTMLQSAHDYSSVFLTAIIMCIIFLKFRKPLMGFAMSSGGAASSGFGSIASKASAWGTGIAGLDGVDGYNRAWDQTGKTLGSFAPKTIGNLKDRAENAVRYGVPGAVAGIVTGRGVAEGFKSGAGPRDELMKRQQRKAGFGFLEGTARTAQEVSEGIKRDSRQNTGFLDAMNDLQGTLPELQQYAKEMEQFEKDEVEFYRVQRDTVGSSIEQETYVDANGKEQTVRRLVKDVENYETQEITHEVILELKPPTPPTLSSAGMSLEDIGIANEYRAENDKLNELLERRTQMRERIYANADANSPLRQISERSTQTEVDEAVKNTYSDEKGFTETSRQRVTGAVKELQNIEKKLVVIEENLAKVEEKYNARNSELDYEHAPEKVLKGIVSGIDNSIAIMEEQNRNNRSNEDTRE